MAYTQTKANLKQTAYNVAGTVVQALAQVGQVENYQDAVNILNGVAENIFTDLAALQDSEPAPAPQQRSGGYNNGGGRSYGGNGGGPLNPATLTLKDKYKKHAGKTLAAVHAEDPNYVEWLAFTAKDPWMNGKAREFLASVGAPSNQGAALLGQAPEPQYP